MLWTVVEHRHIRKFLAVVLVAFSPILTIETYYHAFLIGCFISYISHMFGDALTNEGWTLLKIGGFQIRIQLPIAFKAGSMFETHVVYPLLFLALGYVFFMDADFWKLKLLKEGHDLLMVYKSII